MKTENIIDDYFTREAEIQCELYKKSVLVKDFIRPHNYFILGFEFRQPEVDKLLDLLKEAVALLKSKNVVDYDHQRIDEFFYNIERITKKNTKNE